jgi:hypothetical protein
MSLFTIDQNKVNEIKKQAVEDARKVAYAAEADPLFFKVQRNEATLQEWQDKILEIKKRFPKL